MVQNRSDDLCVAIPESAFTPTGFRAWCESRDFPTRGRIDLCDGDVLVDMSPERLQTHALVKGEIHRVLGNLVVLQNSGRIYPDGVRFTHERAAIDTKPDGIYYAYEALDVGRVEVGETDDDAYGIAGEVDWILEVVSPCSVTKDRHRFLKKYAEARVREYWIVDARGTEIQFDLNVLTPKGYRLAPEIDGWRHSPVFGCSFRLERTRDSRGGREYRLLTR